MREDGRTVSSETMAEGELREQRFRAPAETATEIEFEIGGANVVIGPSKHTSPLSISALAFH